MKENRSARGASDRSQFAQGSGHGGRVQAI